MQAVEKISPDLVDRSAVTQEIADVGNWIRKNHRAIGDDDIHIQREDGWHKIIVKFLFKAGLDRNTNTSVFYDGKPRFLPSTLPGFDGTFEVDSHDESDVLGCTAETGVNGKVKLKVPDTDLADGPFVTRARKTFYMAENHPQTHPWILTSLPELLSNPKCGFDGECFLDIPGACFFEAQSFTSFFGSLVLGIFDNRTTHHMNIRIGTWVARYVAPANANFKVVDNFHPDEMLGVRRLTESAQHQLSNARPSALAFAAGSTAISTTPYNSYRGEFEYTDTATGRRFNFRVDISLQDMHVSKVPV